MAGRVTVQVCIEELWNTILEEGKAFDERESWALLFACFYSHRTHNKALATKSEGGCGKCDFLNGSGGFTIFAPSDSAFSLLPRSAVSLLQNNTEKLREVVLFHVVPGELRLDNLDNNDQLSSASPRGRKLRVNMYNHGSDQQLIEPLPKEIIVFWFSLIVAVQVVTVNGARIRQPDMLATNGVIHVIDRVLYPMADLSILDHLTSCDTFTGANVAVTGAGLTPVLEQEGPFTVFLPTTEAFAAIDNATVSSYIQNITLLQREYHAVTVSCLLQIVVFNYVYWTDVLMYHIVPGAHFSEGLRDGTWLTTLAQEQELLLRVTSDGYSRRLAGVGHAARVIKHDIIATNGVIHVIDTVLRPELETPICGHF
ncbi:Transforming growth factor-beta-induced protein ig-h3 [Portunus trituberculatus]|uniref:Transforming growth factor-beta-induced protein ig-h3 n=1 Tax=Portunus trituberculatus TaxID=210409 RepID=A0A5B7CQH1_PORTR|nr:Transforming growth factor-beta-induced protein ig-h3 [Portunus trituberculatus]